ncbi:30S ribosomal protein S19 [Candidatus Woesearchaeota archaeon]|nr:30S ribosomal protein S19 [Candidatus Woesearchaeota archaeon]MBW3017235.1 30S ribosomal protein S19 [Candidatus Woesearchaeota archaeon]
MAKKEFTYRGKTLEELQKLSLKEFAQMLPSNPRRSIVRGLTDEQKNLLRKLKNGKDAVKTHAREMVVLPEMVGKTILVHKGNNFEAVRIEPEMIGLKLGDFAQTRKSVQHSAPGIGATKSTGSISVK